jgi:hypothetical protein
MSFAAITLCVACQRVFVFYFVIDSVRELLDSPSYTGTRFKNEQSQSGWSVIRLTFEPRTSKIPVQIWDPPDEASYDDEDNTVSNSS